MEPLLRDVRPADLPAVHALNEACAPHVGSEPLDVIRGFAERVPYFRIVERQGRVAAFLVGMTQETPYGSPNFRWFLDRYASFAYVDRVAVEEASQGRGLGRMLYDDFQAFGRARAPVLACEVNLRPRNDGSLAFHARMGFRPVGTGEAHGKTVQYMIKELSGSPAVPRRGAA